MPVLPDSARHMGSLKAALPTSHRYLEITAMAPLHSL